MQKNKINGFENEYQFYQYLNGRRVGMLNPIMIELIYELYGNLDKESHIAAKIDYNQHKTDLMINVDGVIKRISIKVGIKNSVHVEGISSFIHFLIENKISKRTVIEYLKYHYADGTTNGTGEKRISVEEYKSQHQEKIDQMNAEFNQPDFLLKCINRFVLRGRNSLYKVDALVYGTVEDFIWITKEDIYEIILLKKDIYSTAVHFGPLTCQPLKRCLNYDTKTENKRFCIQIKWYNLGDEIIECMNKKLSNFECKYHTD